MNSNSNSEPNITQVQVGLLRQLALINAAIHHGNSSENNQVKFNRLKLKFNKFLPEFYSNTSN